MQVLEKYQLFEKQFIVNKLADWETMLVEEALPVPASPAMEKEADVEEDDE